MQGLRPEILAGIPDDMYFIVREIEDSFVVSTPDLRRLTNHIEGELQKGVSLEGSDIPMNVTWVMGYPTGKERGRYLTLDFGGTNVRVCDTILSGRERDFHVTQEKTKLPHELRTGTAEQLWDFVADCLGRFLEKNYPEGKEKLPLAFTFSYPVTQTSITSGILQRWTKSLNVSGVVGHDVVAQLQDALDRKNVPATIVALANDTVGTLMSSAYRDPEVKIGSVISTGCNAAYMENYESVTKIEGQLGRVEHANEKLIAINTEYGAYDNNRQMLPLTSFDETVDRISPHPGSQVYEKMVAGQYLGEIYRLVLLELHRVGQLLKGKDISILEQPNVIDASFMSIAEADMSKSLEEMRKLFEGKLGLILNSNELKVCRYLTELVGTRAARLYACGIAAICRRIKVNSCRVGVDGAVFNHYTNFRERASHALREILDWPYYSDDLVTFHTTEDGSGIGAAIIAAVASEGRGGDNDLRPRSGY